MRSGRSFHDTPVLLLLLLDVLGCVETELEPLEPLELLLDPLELLLEELDEPEALLDEVVVLETELVAATGV